MWVMLKDARISLISLIVFVASSTSMRTAACQEANPPETHASSIFYVSVTNDSGHSIMGLGPSDFTISIENTHPSINYFSNRDVPASIGILFDVSGSMRNKGSKLEAVRQGLVSFADVSNSSSQFFIVAIGRRPRLVTDWTSPGSAVAAGMEDLRSGGFAGATALYDACVLAINKIREAKLSKRVLILVTDGQDNGSQSGWASLRELLEQSAVIVYSIAITEPANDSLSAFGRSFLEELSAKSGGRVFYPASGSEGLQSLGLIADEIRHQYAIGVNVEGLKGDGKWHEIKVLVGPHEIQTSGTEHKKIHLKARTRKSFFDAPKVTGQ